MNYKKVVWPNEQYFHNEGIEPATDEFKSLVNKLLLSNTDERLKGVEQIFDQPFFADIKDSIPDIVAQDEGYEVPEGAIPDQEVLKREERFAIGGSIYETVKI